MAAIDIKVEKLISLWSAAGRIPSLRDGGRTNASTVYRWITKGVRGIRLEGARVGGRVFTSAEALQRFIDRQSADLVGEPTELPPSPAARLRASIDAGNELDALWN